MGPIKKYRPQILQTIIFIIGLMVLYFFLRKDAQIIRVPKVKTLVKTIETEKQLAANYTTVISTDKAVVKLLNGRIEDMLSELERIKASKDTFKIVQQQDTLIGLLVKQGDIKDSVINNQDKVITIHQSTIKNQDTLILLKDHEIKKVKRQRNLSLITNGILTTLLIIK